MASVASELVEGVTAHVQSDSLEDAWEICAESAYFPNNLHNPWLSMVQWLCLWKYLATFCRSYFCYLLHLLRGFGNERLSCTGTCEWLFVLFFIVYFIRFCHVLWLVVGECILLEGERSTRPSVLSTLCPVKLCCASIVLTLTTNDDHNINILPSGHAELRDCSPMRCWQVMHFCVFIHFVLHMRLASDMAHLSLQVYPQLDAGCWVSSCKQTDQSWPPIYRTGRQSVNVLTQFVYDAIQVIAEYVLMLDRAWFSDLYFCCSPQAVCIMKLCYITVQLQCSQLIRVNKTITDILIYL
jgi:hypothetical protein